MKTTENGTRKFTREEKLQILQEAKQRSVKTILEKCLTRNEVYYREKGMKPGQRASTMTRSHNSYSISQ